MNSSKRTIRDCINLVKKELHAICPETEIRSFSNLIFEELFGLSSAQVFIRESFVVNDEDFQKIQVITTDLKDHKPIQYILGKTEFYGLQFTVSPDVLIPRPETEELVKWILDKTKMINPAILDIGTGSGCIAVTLAKNISGAKVSAMDVSTKALEVARENALLNQVQINFIHDDILHPKTDQQSQFDCIVSNPPYVRELEKSAMQKNVLDYEPHQALFVPDNDALVFYRAICRYAKTHLVKMGWLYFEINESLGNQVVELMKQHGFSNIELRQDLFGKDRMVRGQMA